MSLKESTKKGVAVALVGVTVVTPTLSTVYANEESTSVATRYETMSLMDKD